MPTFDPTKVKTTFKGQVITMFAKDSLIKAARNEDGWIFTPSSTGGGGRARNANKSGTVEVMLHQASPSLDTLQGYMDADELSGTGAGVLHIEDITTGAALVHATNAWIRKIPDWERNKEYGDVPFTFESDDLQIKHSGTTQA